MNAVSGPSTHALGGVVTVAAHFYKPGSMYVELLQRLANLPCPEVKASVATTHLHLRSRGFSKLQPRTSGHAHQSRDSARIIAHADVNVKIPKISILCGTAAQ